VGLSGVLGSYFSKPQPEWNGYDIFQLARDEKCDSWRASKTEPLVIGPETARYDRMVLKARHAFKSSAENGDVLAQYCLGTTYRVAARYGEFKDYERMVNWYRLAATQGDMLAQYNLGLILSSMYYGRSNYREAAKWFILAGEQGDARAQHKLGSYFSTGAFGSPSPISKGKIDFDVFLTRMENYEAKISSANFDFVKARKWYERAAIQGDPTAQLLLAGLYEHGLGGEVDYASARTWYRRVVSSNDILLKDSANRALDRIRWRWTW